MVVLRHAVRRLRGQILAYGLGLTAWGAIEAMLFPSVRESLGSIEYPKEILEAFGAANSNLASPRTFMDVEFFSLGPLVLATFALFASTGALAGEEGAGTMEGLASLPISRRQMFVEKLLAVSSALIATCVIVSLGWVVSTPIADFGRQLTLFRLTAATFAMLTFAAFMGATGLLLGAVAPSRGAAGAWGAALLIASYLMVVISSVADSVENLKYASPYYYSDLTGILASGVEWEHQLVLWTSTALVGWVALRAFEGRELGAERWQFLAPIRGGPTMTSTGSLPTGERLLVWTQARSRTWWATAVFAVVLLSAGAGAVGGFVIGAGATSRNVSAEGWVVAPSARVLAPTSGTVRSLLVAGGAEVTAGQDLGWVQSALDGSLVPFRAPLAGRVADITPKPGEFVGLGAPIVTVHQLDALYVVLEVSERDIDAIAPGQSIQVTLTALDATLATEVESVTRVPLTGDGVRSRDEPKYEVKSARLAPDGRTTAGMVADGRIRVSAGKP